MKRLWGGWFAALVLVAANGCSEDIVGPGGAPSSPQNVSATSNGAGWVLSWTPNTEPDIAGYDVYRVPAYATQGTQAGLVSTAAATATSVTLLVEGGEWIYHVRARDLQGELSAPSTGVLITVAASGGGSDLPAAPEGVRQATK